MNKKALSLSIVLGIIWVFSSVCCFAATEIDLSLTSVAGVKDRAAAVAAFKLEGEEASLSGSFRFAETDRELSEEKGRLRAGYDPRLSDHWSLWFFDEAGYDRMRELESENYAGLGPKYTFVDSEALKASFSAGALYHCTSYENAERQDVLRWSLRPKILVKRGGWEAALIAFYQPNVQQPDDYIAKGETSIRYAVTATTGLKLTIEGEHRSLDPIEQNELITTLSVSIRSG